ncbi:MAG: TnsA endonuclease N-terminal domain-containing protein [Anaerolineae bacterium]|jgi:hypothetical protein
MKLNRKPPPGNVRRVRSTGQNIRGVITNKAGRLVQFESWAERSLLLRLDRDPGVTDYGSQPEQFKFIDPQGKWHTYTPDFIVWRRDGQVEIHEVTLSKRRTRPNIRQREAAAAEICRTRDWRYVVHTEQTLPQGSELANLLALFRYRVAACADQAVTGAVFNRLSHAEPTALLHLVTQVAHELGLPQPSVVAALGHMLWHGQVNTDLNRLIFTDNGIAPDVLIRPGQEEERHDSRIR